MTVAGIKTPCLSLLESTVKLLIPLTVAVRPLPTVFVLTFLFMSLFLPCRVQLPAASTVQLHHKDH